MNWSLTLRERREREELPDDASPPAFMYQKGTRFRAGNLAAATTALPRLSISTHHSWLRDLAVISPSSNRNRVMVCRSFAKQRVRHVMDRIKVSISQSEVGYPRGLKFPTSANPGSSAMHRTIRLRSCRLSAPTQYLSRRAYNSSASSDAEAFLKPAGLSHPGVTYLSLNRPKTKNAISVNLLQVRLARAFNISLPAVTTIQLV